MQANDLNRLIGQYDNLDDIKNILISPGRTKGKEQLTKEMLLKAKETINPILLQKVRMDVEYYQKLGKSRRWIKRWIKRKYNITEY